MQTDQIPSNWRWEKQADGRIAVWDNEGKPRCGGKKSDGTPCRQFPVRGSYRCIKHNGKAPVGEAHHAFKTGETSRYFRFLPSRLKSRYAELLESGKLNDLSENLALLDLRLTELANRMELGEFGAGYSQLRSLHQRAQRDINTAFNSTDAEERRDALQSFLGQFNDMGELITTGQRDYQTWQQIIQLTAERRQLVKTISDIEHKGENSVPIAQLMGLFLQVDTLWKRVNRLESAEDRAKEFAWGLNNIVEFKGTD